MSRLEEIVLPVLQARGVVLFELTLRREQGGWVLRVVIDTADGPGQPVSVSVDQCADVSRDLSAALDVDELFDHPYSLEVSSPGVERPLRTLRDFERFQGKLAKVWLVAPLPDKTVVLQARLAGVRGQAVVMSPDGGEPREIAFANIKKAQLVFESAATPKDKAKNPKQRSKERR